MENQDEELRIKQMIDELVEKAKVASKEYLKLDQKTSLFQTTIHK